MKKMIYFLGVPIILAIGAYWLHLEQELEQRESQVRLPVREVRKGHPKGDVAERQWAPIIARISDQKLHRDERIEAVRELSPGLGEKALDALFSFLEKTPEDHREEWLLVCNEIFEVLRKRHLAPEVYTERLIILLQSPEVDPVIRDYACQQLSQWLAGVDEGGGEADPRLVPLAFRAMLAESLRPENGQLTLPGTALNAMADTVIRGREAARELRPEVAEAALQVVDDESYANYNRISALQAAAVLGASGVRERCRAFLSSSLSPFDLRLSSVAALGLTGDESDLELLRSLTKDRKLSYAAKAALKRLQESSAPNHETFPKS